MKLIWSKRANTEWKKVATYIHSEFGKKASLTYLQKTKMTERKLLKYPELGSPELLLSDKKLFYRSIIISKHSKLIYYIKNDEVRISDIWDMRRNPSILANRIKTKNI